MALQVFLRFKQASILADSFSRVFYENMEVQEGQEVKYFVNVNRFMCVEKVLQPAALVGIVDGVTSMAFLQKFALEGFSVSVKLNSQFFEECFEGDRIEIRAQVVDYDVNMKIGRVRGEVFKGENLVLLCSHTVCYTGRH